MVSFANFRTVTLSRRQREYGHTKIQRVTEGFAKRKEVSKCQTEGTNKWCKVEGERSLQNPMNIGADLQAD